MERPRPASLTFGIIGRTQTDAMVAFSNLILLYHSFSLDDESQLYPDASDNSVVVAEQDLRQQLSRLQEIKVRFVGLREILALPNDANDCVTITIDDGHISSWAVAFPVLQEFSVPAVFYVVAGKLDDPEYVNSDQIQELHRHGMLIGSHTVTHRHLPLLTDAEVKWELQESRDILEEVVKDQVVDLAIPGGHFNSRIIKLARACGYETVATCNVGAIGAKTDPMRIPRVEIRQGLTEDAFVSTFSSSTLRRLQLLEFGKACMRRTLGLTTYDRIRVAAHRLFSIKR